MVLMGALSSPIAAADAAAFDDGVNDFDDDFG